MSSNCRNASSSLATLEHCFNNRCAEAFSFANTGGCFQIIVETSALCDAV